MASSLRSSFKKFLSTPFWILPAILSFFRLRELYGLVPMGGSDAFGAVAVARIVSGMDSGESGFFIIPKKILAFSYPEGMGVAALPEFFSEPLYQWCLAIFINLGLSPLGALQVGFALSTLLNIWVTYAIFMRRYGLRSKAAAVLGWAVLALSPWIWGRTTFHWHLSFIPIVVAVLGMWWDAWVHGRVAQRSLIFLGHLLLALQSVYYTFFMAFTSSFMVVASAFGKNLRVLILLGLMGVAVGGLYSNMRMGGLSTVSDSVRANTRSKADFHTYSIRLREMARGGPGSLWNALLGLESPHAQRPGPSHDEEGFTAPIPKLFVLFVFLVALLNGQRNLISKFLWLTAGLLLLMLQEIPWVRNEILSSLLPFIRSYGRLHLFWLIVMSFFIVEVLSRALSLKSDVQSMGAVVMGLFLIVVDYGWPQSPRAMTHEVVCKSEFQKIADAKAPLFMQTDVEFYRWYCSGMRDLSVYAMTGVPQISRPWNYPDGKIERGSEACEHWSPKFEAAVKAFGAAQIWVDGSKQTFDGTLKCLVKPGMKVESLGAYPESGGQQKVWHVLVKLN